MAKIGSMVLGGRGLGCGAAFQLSAPAPFSHLYAPAGEVWEVEAHEGEATIVARTPDLLSRSDLLARGLEQVQRCLDLLSFEKRQDLLVKRPTDDHVVLFVRGGTYVAQHVAVSGLRMGVSFNVVIKDKDGSVVPPDAPPRPVWTPGLRFYRLSQSSSDLYDAYRCLWLGLETLLGTVCPKQRREREREWLLRAMSHIGAQMDLKRFVPTGCTDPVAYIVGTQYDLIRCRLFHAKVVQPFPPAVPNPEEVATAYEELIRLWRDIAERALSVRPGAGGMVTYSGFKMMRDRAVADGLTMFFTDDPSPVNKEDTEVSPLGHIVFHFAKVTYLSETAPGRVSFVGLQPLADVAAVPTIHRICSKAGDAMMTALSIKEGLYLDGVDYLESHQTIRLVNRDLPRVVFGEQG